MTTKEKTQSDAKPKSAQEIERIRDIIFGTQMRQYEQLVATLQSDIRRLEQQIVQLNEQAAERETNQTRTAQLIRQEIRDADGGLRSELRQLTEKLEQEKVGRALLGELFIELGNQIKTGGSLADLLHGLLENE
jgi:predicted RNase H-like nuclease (RuvC/YqgF family)